MRGRRMLASMLAVALLAAAAIGVSQAQAPGPENRLQTEGIPGQTGLENTVTSDIPVQQWVGTTIPYAGRLSDSVGQPAAEGVYDFTFTLYAAETGGEPLWSEVQAGVAVQDGSFSVSLGSVSPIPPAVLSGRILWLAVGVRGPGESDLTTLAPRQRVSAGAAADAACPHDHFGELWTGSSSEQGLRINNSGTGNGLLVDSAGVGVQVYQAGNDGVYVIKAGSPSTTTPSSYRNGFEVAGAEASGLYVGHADLDGVTVNWADWYGVYVIEANSDGVRVDMAGQNGVYAVSDSATNYGGLFRNVAAGGAGLYAAGGDNTAPDLVLGVYGAGDDGRIYSWPQMTGSDILLFSNDEVHVHLDEDSNSTSTFAIYNGANTPVFSVDETGAVTFGSEASAYGSRAVYAVQATGSWIEDFGTAQLVDGQVTVTIEPVFAQMVNLGEYQVFLTPLGDCPLYIADKTPASFTVKAMGGQRCSIAFDYRLVAKRLGYEKARLEPMNAGTEEDD